MMSPRALECFRMPSRTSQVRFRPWPPFSRYLTTRRLCSLWRKTPRGGGPPAPPPPPPPPGRHCAAGHEVVLLWKDEDLGLVLQTPKGLAVDDAVAVTLELGADGRRRLRTLSAA